MNLFFYLFCIFLIELSTGGPSGGPFAIYIYLSCTYNSARLSVSAMLALGDELRSCAIYVILAMALSAIIVVIYWC